MLDCCDKKLERGCHSLHCDWGPTDCECQPKVRHSMIVRLSGHLVKWSETHNMMSGCETNKSHCSNTHRPLFLVLFSVLLGRAISVLSVMACW